MAGEGISKKTFILTTIFGAVVGGVGIALLVKAIPKLFGAMQELMKNMRDN
ncbi:MAG: hypothetical protein QF898_19905 [SAR202 cluster bacterium]|jgi:hypothetical protein|nr:hypothetical protein [SAR202 cluster bacterium]MDP6511642.1 hypothetical protein [SAR202 cluster bacterium]MDP6713653.1 hypothetical protein [SAR202 cluster bacterium]